MGFHQFDTNFTLDPRKDIPDHQNISRGLGNQVTVEFNLFFRFHCAISMRDERYAEGLIQEQEKAMLDAMAKAKGEDNAKEVPNAKDMTMEQFLSLLKAGAQQEMKDPWLQEFGLKNG